MKFPNHNSARYWKLFFLNQLKELEDNTKIRNILNYHDFKYYDEFTYLQESIKLLCEWWINFLFLINECWEIFYKLKDKKQTPLLIKSLKNSVYSLTYEINIPGKGVTGRSYIMYMKRFIYLNNKHMIKESKQKMVSLTV